MNFFSNLWGGLQNAGSSIWGGIKNAFSKISNVSQTAGAGNAGAVATPFYSQGGAPYQSNFGVNFGPVSTSYTPGAAHSAMFPGLGTATLPYGFSPRPAVTNPQGGNNGVNMGPITTSYSSGIQQPVGSTTSGRYDAYGRESNSTTGNPYQDSSGNWVIPSTAFSGMNGSGGQQVNSPNLSSSGVATGSNAASGLGGFGGFGGFGGLGGLGGTSPFSGIYQTEEDKKRQDEFQKQFKTGGSTTPSTSSGGIFNGMFGNVPGLNGLNGLFGANPALASTPVTPQHNLPPLQAPNVNPTQNVNDLTQPTDPALNTSHAHSPNDVQAQNDAINQNFYSSKQQLDQKYPSDKGPLTTDTPEQDQFMQQSGDPYGVKAALDAYKASNTQLFALEAQRLDVLKNIQALNSAYTPIIQDIKNNPDLPKGLAARRLQDLNTKQKDTLTGFNNQLDLLNTSIGDQNQQVNRQFNIVQFSSNQAEKATDNARQFLQVLVSTGAIGGMSDKELASLSQQTGVPISGLQKARTSSNDPTKDIITETDDNGNVHGIDKKSGRTLWTVAGAGKSNASSSNGADVPGYAQGLVTQLLNRNSGVTFSNLPKADKQLALQEFSKQGLSIPRPLTSAEKNAQQAATSGLDSIENIRKLQNNGGLPLTADFATPNSGIGGVIGRTLSPNLSNFRTYKNEAADIITRIRTGAALNSEELTFYQSKLPVLGDNADTVNTKLNQLTGFFLGMSGVPVTVTDQSGHSFLFSDLYEPKQRLGLRRALDSGFQLSY